MYNVHWGKQSDAHLALIEPLVLQRLPAPARILDLCCGTGQLAHALTRKGYAVVGIDGSEGMLSYARTNAPEARFVLGDAREFRVQDPFDAVLCAFDSLNHLMCESDLADAFNSVADALHPGGLPAFDLNLEVKYLKTWSGEFSVIGEHEVAFVRTSVDLESRCGIFDGTLFYDESDESWSRHDVRLTQTWYSEGLVERLLAEAGFDPPAKHVQQPMPGDPQIAQNMLFIASKSR
jgi:SAM-dependent methyltransferase